MAFADKSPVDVWSTTLNTTGDIISNYNRQTTHGEFTIIHNGNIFIYEVVNDVINHLFRLVNVKKDETKRSDRPEPKPDSYILPIAESSNNLSAPKISAGNATDAGDGKYGKQNNDSVVNSLAKYPNHNRGALFIVADGIADNSSQDSQMAANGTLSNYYAFNVDLIEAIRKAERNITNKGSTVNAILINDNKVQIAYAGDSPTFMVFRDGRIFKITIDQTHGYREIVTQIRSGKTFSKKDFDLMAHGLTNAEVLYSSIKQRDNQKNPIETIEINLQGKNSLEILNEGSESEQPRLETIEFEGSDILGFVQAVDGITDINLSEVLSEIVTPQEMSDFVMANQDNPQAAADAILNRALERNRKDFPGEGDNLTVQVVLIDRPISPPTIPSKSATSQQNGQNFLIDILNWIKENPIQSFTVTTTAMVSALTFAITAFFTTPFIAIGLTIFVVSAGIILYFVPKINKGVFFGFRGRVWFISTIMLFIISGIMSFVGVFVMKSDSKLTPTPPAPKAATIAPTATLKAPATLVPTKSVPTGIPTVVPTQISDAVLREELKDTICFGDSLCGGFGLVRNTWSYSGLGAGELRSKFDESKKSFGDAKAIIISAGANNPLNGDIDHIKYMVSESKRLGLNVIILVPPYYEITLNKVPLSENAKKQLKTTITGINELIDVNTVTVTFTPDLDVVHASEKVYKNDIYPQVLTAVRNWKRSQVLAPTQSIPLTPKQQKPADLDLKTFNGNPTMNIDGKEALIVAGSGLNKNYDVNTPLPQLLGIDSAKINGGTAEEIIAIINTNKELRREIETKKYGSAILWLEATTDDDGKLYQLAKEGKLDELDREIELIGENLTSAMSYLNQNGIIVFGITGFEQNDTNLERGRIRGIIIQKINALLRKSLPSTQIVDLHELVKNNVIKRDNVDIGRTDGDEGQHARQAGLLKISNEIRKMYENYKKTHGISKGASGFTGNILTSGLGFVVNTITDPKIFTGSLLGLGLLTLFLTAAGPGFFVILAFIGIFTFTLTLTDTPPKQESTQGTIWQPQTFTIKNVQAQPNPFRPKLRAPQKLNSGITPEDIIEPARAWGNLIKNTFNLGQIKPIALIASIISFVVLVIQAIKTNKKFVIIAILSGIGLGIVGWIALGLGGLGLGAGTVAIPAKSATPVLKSRFADVDWYLSLFQSDTSFHYNQSGFDRVEEITKNYPEQIVVPGDEVELPSGRRYVIKSSEKITTLGTKIYLGGKSKVTNTLPNWREFIRNIRLTRQERLNRIGKEQYEEAKRLVMAMRSRLEGITPEEIIQAAEDISWQDELSVIAILDPAGFLPIKYLKTKESEQAGIIHTLVYTFTHIENDAKYRAYQEAIKSGFNDNDNLYDHLIQESENSVAKIAHSRPRVIILPAYVFERLRGYRIGGFYHRGAKIVVVSDSEIDNEIEFRTTIAHEYWHNRLSNDENEIISLSNGKAVIEARAVANELRGAILAGNNINTDLRTNNWDKYRLAYNAFLNLERDVLQKVGDEKGRIIMAQFRLGNRKPLEDLMGGWNGIAVYFENTGFEVPNSTPPSNPGQPSKFQRFKNWLWEEGGVRAWGKLKNLLTQRDNTKCDLGYFPQQKTALANGFSLVKEIESPSPDKHLDRTIPDQLLSNAPSSEVYPPATLSITNIFDWLVPRVSAQGPCPVALNEYNNPELMTINWPNPLDLDFHTVVNIINRIKITHSQLVLEAFEKLVIAKPEIFDRIAKEKGIGVETVKNSYQTAIKMHDLGNIIQLEDGRLIYRPEMKYDGAEEESVKIAELLLEGNYGYSKDINNDLVYELIRGTTVKEYAFVRNYRGNYAQKVMAILDQTVAYGRYDYTNPQNHPSMLLIAETLINNLWKFNWDKLWFSFLEDQNTDPETLEMATAIYGLDRIKLILAINSQMAKWLGEKVITKDNFEETRNMLPKTYDNNPCAKTKIGLIPSAYAAEGGYQNPCPLFSMQNLNYQLERLKGWFAPPPPPPAPLPDNSQLNINHFPKMYCSGIKDEFGNDLLVDKSPSNDDAHDRIGKTIAFCDQGFGKSCEDGICTINSTKRFERVKVFITLEDIDGAKTDLDELTYWKDEDIDTKVPLITNQSLYVSVIIPGKYLESGIDRIEKVYIDPEVLNKIAARTYTYQRGNIYHIKYRIGERFDSNIRTFVPKDIGNKIDLLNQNYNIIIVGSSWNNWSLDQLDRALSNLPNELYTNKIFLSGYPNRAAANVVKYPTIFINTSTIWESDFVHELLHSNSGNSGYTYGNTLPKYETVLLKNLIDRAKFYWNPGAINKNELEKFRYGKYDIGDQTLEKYGLIWDENIENPDANILGRDQYGGYKCVDNQKCLKFPWSGDDNLSRLINVYGANDPQEWLATLGEIYYQDSDYLCTKAAEYCDFFKTIYQGRIYKNGEWINKPISNDK
ncbi:hypothetical protein HZB69_00210 [Candidatus Amesbacteria bacterium]|nr:hypothetical protein [Candidatus Amesbacteria bacterium]